MTATTLFKALSDSTRLRCLLLLHRHQELCVCDLTNALGLPQPRVSHHLGNLRQTGLVQDRRQGSWTYYRLHPDLPAWARTVIEATFEGTSGEAPYAEDHDRLAAQPCPSARCV